MDSKTFRYFAYGSNMLKRRLTASERAPSAKSIGIGYVEGRRINFNKVSKDGSGKCDAEITGNNSDRVYGVLFEIASSERSALDRSEGLDKGYKEELVDVVTESGKIQAMTYIATKKEPILRPYHWYKAITIAGAVENGLPMCYIEWLRAFESVEDPNTERRTKNEALLFAS